MAAIFLSHSSSDDSAAIAMRDWMLEEGWNDVFLDLDPERGIKAGERWQEALKRASANCELVVFLISPAWVASKWCLAEFLLAKQLNKRVFGVIIQSTPLESIPVEMAGEWQIVDLTTGPDNRFLSVRQSTEDRTQDVRFSADGLERLKIGLLGAGLDPTFFDWPPESDPNRAPYRGLRALEEGDAGIFFGREGPIVEGLDHLRGLREAALPRMLVILGASGAGKSSYMQAGLLPRLRRDSRHFRVLPVIRPRRSALEGDGGLIVALELALREADHPTARSEIRNACHSGPEALARLLEPLIATAAVDTASPSLVLPIDQSEELFHAEGADEAQAFLGLLRGLLELESMSVIALITIRSDSYEQLQSAGVLEGIRQHTYSLPPMPRGSYSEVILGPVRRLVEAKGPFVIEEILVEALLGDIDENVAKDSLPLLAFTLERLYRDEGGDGDLKLSEYETTGRIRGAIKAAVQQALKAADDDPNLPRDNRKRLALLRRAMIPALARVDPDTGSPQRRVARLSDLPAEARPLVALMVDQRLLATDVSQENGETTVEPAHESLLRQWDQLNGWLEEEAEDLGVAEATRRAARDWVANGREHAWLDLSGSRLQQAEKVASRTDFAKLYGPEKRAYLAACRTAEELRRAEEEAARQRELDAQMKLADERKARQNIFAAALAISIVLLGVAGWQWREAGQQATIADSNAQQAEIKQIEIRNIISEVVEEMRLPWPLDVLSPDYHHLSQLDLARQQRNEVFPVMPDLIETMLTANSFAPHMLNGKLVVVVRGAKLVSPEQGVRGGIIELKDMRPDHRQPQSVVIVYDRNEPSLVAFSASTVPSQRFIERAIAQGGRGANLMPTGSYEFVVRPFYGGGRMRPGNIMMDNEDVFVVRRTRNPTYEIIDDVSLSQPRNGILPSFRPLSEFHSQGSILLNGSQNREPPYDFRGAFREFRTELGLDHPPSGSDHGQVIGVVILTGLDLALGARLIEQGIELGDKDFESNLRRLRFGSVGEYVENLQRELGLQVTGSLDSATFRKLSELQFESLGWWDGILSPEVEEKLDIQVLPASGEPTFGDSSNSQSD